MWPFEWKRSSKTVWLCHTKKQGKLKVAVTLLKFRQRKLGWKVWWPRRHFLNLCSLIVSARPKVDVWFFKSVLITVKIKSFFGKILLLFSRFQLKICGKIFSRIQQFFVTPFSRFRWQPSGNTDYSNWKLWFSRVSHIRQDCTNSCLFECWVLILTSDTRLVCSPIIMLPKLQNCCDFHWCSPFSWLIIIYIQYMIPIPYNISTVHHHLHM